MKTDALRIGLTGGIGSGKSTVADIFRSKGIPVIDLDQISRDLTNGRDTEVLQKIHSTFGADIFEADGTLSRSRLRELIFSSPAKKKELENILHPLICKKTEQQYQILSQTASMVIFDIPLLAERNTWQEQLDKVLVIDCDEEVQIRRVMARSGWSREQVKAVIATQASRQERLVIATDVINNSMISMEELKTEVFTLLQKWQK